MKMMMKDFGANLVVITIASLFFFGAVRETHAVVFVSPNGSDVTGDGSAENPFASLVPAISSNDKEIVMASGQFIIGSGMIIPPDTHVRGGMAYVDVDVNPDSEDFAWVPDTMPTYLLALGVSGRPAIELRDRAHLEWLTIAGGFYSLEMFPASKVSEVTFMGGQFSTILVRESEVGKPVLIENCKIMDGGGGLRIEAGGNASISETLFTNTSSRSIFAISAGEVIVKDSVIQHSDSDGIAFFGSGDYLVENCLFRNNRGHGIKVSQSAPIIRGCLFDKNEYGIEIYQDTLAEGNQTVVENCTLVRNRQSGIYVKYAQPDLLGNVIALNGVAGVFEDKVVVYLPGEEVGDPPVIDESTNILHVNRLEGNLFWENETANYIDEEGARIITYFDDDTQTTVTETFLLHYNTEEEINFALENVSPPDKNLVADPLFVDVEDGCFQVEEGSPILDLRPWPNGFDKDLEGNDRLVDFAGVNLDELDAMDLGAFERQSTMVSNFGGLYGDTISVDNGDETFRENIVSSEWSYDEFPAFMLPKVEFLPGKIRVSSLEDGSYGSIWRSAMNWNPAYDKLLVIKQSITAMDILGVPKGRIRVNGSLNNDVQDNEGNTVFPSLDMMIGTTYEGSTFYRPTPQGRDYQVVVDLRQGGYRDTLPQDVPDFRGFYNIDMADWGGYANRVPTDYTKIQAEYIDRATYDAQFTNQLAHWSFSSLPPSSEWESEGIRDIWPGIRDMNNPVFYYDSGKSALVISTSKDNCFGWWKSRPIPVKIGKNYRIDITVSSPHPLGEGAHFRLRTTTPEFEMSDELIVYSFAPRPELPGETYGAAGPVEEPKTYTMYGHMSEDFAEAYTDVVDLNLFFDVWGFYGGDRSNYTKLYLHDVAVWTESD